MKSTNSLSAEDLKKLTSLLNKLEPGFLPLEVFLEIARLTVLSIIELVPLRKATNGKLEVLLLPRAADDKFWPHEVHTPGTVIRPTDVPFGIDSAFQRILSEELQFTKITKPVFVGELLQSSKRGAEYAQIYFTKVKDEPRAGAFYDVEDLPGNLMDSQRNFIHQAVEAFRLSKWSR